MLEGNDAQQILQEVILRKQSNHNQGVENLSNLYPLPIHRLSSSCVGRAPDYFRVRLSTSVEIAVLVK